MSSGSIFSPIPCQDSCTDPSQLYSILQNIYIPQISTKFCSMKFRKYKEDEWSAQSPIRVCAPPGDKSFLTCSLLCPPVLLPLGLCTYVCTCLHKYGSMWSLLACHCYLSMQRSPQKMPSPLDCVADTSAQGALV